MTPKTPANIAPTPAWTVDRLFDRLAIVPSGKRWLDPCAGRGDLMRAVNARVPGIQWTAVEQRAGFERKLSKLGRAVHGDFFEFAFDEGLTRGRYDVVILHPPHQTMLPESFVRYARMLAPAVIALVPVSFFMHVLRYVWFAEERSAPQSIWMLPNTVRLDEATTETMAWVVWDDTKRRSASFEYLNLTNNRLIIRRRWAKKSKLP